MAGPSSDDPIGAQQQQTTASGTPIRVTVLRHEKQIYEVSITRRDLPTRFRLCRSPVDWIVVGLNLLLLLATLELPPPGVASSFISDTRDTSSDTRLDLTVQDVQFWMTLLLNTGWRWLPGSLPSLLWFFWRWRAWSGTVLQERLLVIRDMGIQLSAHCASGKCKRQVFLDTTELEHIVINEGFRLWRIIFYLTAIMRPSSPPPRVPKILSSIPATLTSSIRPPSSDAPQNELLVTDSGGKLALQHQQQLQRRSQRKSRPAASAAGLRPKPYFEMGKSSQETVLGPTDRRLVLLFEDLIPRFAELHQIYLGCLSVLDLE